MLEHFQHCIVYKYPYVVNPDQFYKTFGKARLNLTQNFVYFAFVPYFLELDSKAYPFVY